MRYKILAAQYSLAPETRKLFHTTTIALCLAFAYSLFTHIMIPATHSVAPRVLFRTGAPASEINQYVTFERNDHYLPQGKAYLVKRLGCMPGQYLSRLGNQFFCDGKEIALAMTNDRDGHPLPQFRFTGIIPVGRAFAVGDTVNSYDSRYWGFISLKETEKLVPLF
ncbi:S26 family signal peptidase [Cronobacter sakazakii]|uniref:S26 family signal peptidase n=1 Tax=Cronobacter sakazakii TaxID=28141 RepID=UPI0009BA2E50|nr:S26 family signal peptidase [Cronobacter sakazakii]MDK1224557.1 S26 family signal peptidase [Cronobacter turicensis]EJJ0671533.1 S26 family signal peptidase [Cronobacter sakazakii]EJL7720647.1 S26 family signal peptidase [Cronobacter sakazakii]EJV9557820.1 S26 family signal peptidase [Cronobacter sakazakii]EJV9561875.1 S26 family signal peptidase [Cronobacter sakazakii]